MCFNKGIKPPAVLELFKMFNLFPILSKSSLKGLISLNEHKRSQPLSVVVTIVKLMTWIGERGVKNISFTGSFSCLSLSYLGIPELKKEIKKNHGALCQLLSIGGPRVQSKERRRETLI